MNALNFFIFVPAFLRKLGYALDNNYYSIFTLVNRYSFETNDGRFTAHSIGDCCNYLDYKTFKIIKSKNMIISFYYRACHISVLQPIL